MVIRHLQAHRLPMTQTCLVLSRRTRVESIAAFAAHALVSRCEWTKYPDSSNHRGTAQLSTLVLPDDTWPPCLHRDDP